MQAKSFTVTGGSGELEFEVLCPAGPKSPAEFRLKNEEKSPLLAPYLSVLADKVNRSSSRKVSILFVKPIEQEGQRVGQNVFTVQAKLDLRRSVTDAKKDVEDLLAIINQDDFKEILAKAISPN